MLWSCISIHPQHFVKIGGHNVERMVEVRNKENNTVGHRRRTA